MNDEYKLERKEKKNRTLLFFLFEFSMTSKLNDVISRHILLF